MNMWVLKLRVNQCKNICKNHPQGNKSRIYHEGGSFCRNCDYYFADGFLRCPCCKAMVRHSTRNRKDQDLVLRIWWNILSWFWKYCRFNRQINSSPKWISNWQKVFRQFNKLCFIKSQSEIICNNPSS